MASPRPYREARASAQKQIRDRELAVVLQLLEQALSLEGDVVEFGCYAGDTSVELAQLMQQYPDKWLWLYDSFEGLPEKSVEDNSAAGWRFQKGALKISPVSVETKFKKRQLPDPVIKKAWFSELDPEADLPEKICFALLDGDFYESIKTSLQLVAPKLTEQGIIVVHDYKNPALPGSAKAVSEFVAGNPDKYHFRLASGMAILSKL